MMAALATIGTVLDWIMLWALCISSWPRRLMTGAAFEAFDPAAFRRESLAMEKASPMDWRGIVMASALLLVCRRAG